MKRIFLLVIILFTISHLSAALDHNTFLGGNFGETIQDAENSNRQTHDIGYTVSRYSNSNESDTHGHYGYRYFVADRLTADDITCPAPTGQTETNITDSSAVLGWTENGSASTWEIEWGPTGFIQGSGTVVSTTNNPYTLDSLTGGETYDWYVRSDCGGGDYSDWTGPGIFTMQCGSISPVTLPFTEGWETCSGTRQTDGGIYCNPTCRWNFETDNQGQGRVMWGTDAYQAHNGNGALTMDRYPAGAFTINYSILTLDLSNYVSSTDLELSFWWADHNDEESANDKVWVRDTDTSAWIVIYDLNPALVPSGIYQKVSGLDIDSVLASANPSQTVGATFQLRFGQKGHYWIGYDGLSFDDITIKEVTCPFPVSQTETSISDSSAVLGWTERGSATIWQIMLDTAGFDTAMATPLTVPVNYYTWTSLTGGETYDWYVRSDCGGGDYSTWTGPKTFTLPVIDFPWLEGFEHGGNIPVGWTNEQGEEDWTYINGDGGAGPIENAHSGAYNAFFNDGSHIKLITPPLDLTGLVNPVLSFWNTQVWQYGPHNSIFQDELTVYYKTSVAGEWTQIPIQDYLFCPFDWIEEYCIPLPNPCDTYYIAFQGNNGSCFGICLDDVLVEDLPSCLRPAEMNEHIDQNQVKLDWTEMGSATSWQIMLDTAGFDTAIAIPLTTTNKPFSHSGLRENTTYQWYVRSDCGAGEYSRWTIPETFVFESNPFVFRNTLGGNDIDVAYSIQQTIDSGFVVAGGTRSNDIDVHGNHGFEDFWVVKLNNIGDTCWTKTFGTEGYESARCIQQTIDSGYIVVGNRSIYSMWIIKLNNEGDTLWTKTSAGQGNAIQQTYDSGFIVAGYRSPSSISCSHGGKDFYVIKLNENGDTLWTKCLGGSEDDAAYSIQQTYDSGYVVAGYTRSNDGDVSGFHGLYDFWVVKLNNNSDIVWTRALGGSDVDVAFSIQQTFDSGYIVAGYARSNDGNVHGNHGGSSDCWVARLNSNGGVLWTKCYGGIEMEKINSVQQTNDSGYIIAGETSSNNGDVHGNHGNDDFWVIKLSSAGDTLWTKTLGGSANETAYSIQHTFNSEYIIAGYTGSNDGDVFGSHGYSDFWIVKLAEFPNHIYQDISLSNGWNILSFNVTPNDLDLQNILQPLIDSSALEKVIDESGNIIQNIPGTGWMNTIGNMANTEGYYSKVNANTQLKTSGLPVALPYTIPLTTGWNIMGYPLQESQDALTAVQSLIDDDELIKVLDESGGFIQDIPGIGWMNTIGDFEAGEGYYIKVTDNTSLTLDNPPVLFIGSPPIVQKQPQLYTVPKANPYLPMNIIVTGINIEGYTLQNDDELAVFVNNRLTGAGVISTGSKALTSFAIAMDDPTTTEIDGYLEGNILAFQFKSANLTGSIQLTAKPVFGDLRFSPLGTLVCTLEGSLTAIEQKKEKTFALKCFPNPANNYTNIQYQLPEEGQLQLEVYDLSSHRIATLQNEQQSAGNYHYRFDAALLERGIYLVKIQLRTKDNQYTEVVKFVKN